MSSYSDSELRKEIKNRPKKTGQCTFKARDRLNDSAIQTLKSVLKTGEPLNVNQRRLLSAVSTNNTDVVQELLQANIDPNIVDQLQRSALHLAVSRGYLDVVRILLKHDANPNAQDIIGNTPLHLAACMSNLQMITVLLDAGANVRSLDLHGRNPLQLAESKLQILMRSWKCRTIEMIQLRNQLQQIVDVMISMWRRKDFSLNAPSSYGKDNLDDLELIKLSLSSGPDEEVEDQMSRLQQELRDFSLK